MRVFILALDGLEYNLVIQWKLRSIMQKTYGKLHISPNYYHKDENVPYTPIIWASFITGIPPERHGIKSIFTYGKFLDKIRNMPVIRSIKGKRQIFWRLGLKPRVVNKKDLGKETLFERITPSVAVDVPAYNEPSEVNLRLANAIMKKGVKHYVNAVWKVYQNRKKRVFEKIHEDWKLLMAYFKISDLLGHVYIAKSPEHLRRVYLELDRLVYELKTKLSDDILFLIVSDHGMQPSDDGVTGTHSKHAFWSLNIDTNWRPKDITDFYPKIIEWTKAETTEQFQVK